MRKETPHYTIKVILTLILVLFFTGLITNIIFADARDDWCRSGSHCGGASSKTSPTVVTPGDLCHSSGGFYCDSPKETTDGLLYRCEGSDHCAQTTRSVVQKDQTLPTKLPTVQGDNCNYGSCKIKRIYHFKYPSSSALNCCVRDGGGGGGGGGGCSDNTCTNPPTNFNVCKPQTNEFGNSEDTALGVDSDTRVYCKQPIYCGPDGCGREYNYSGGEGTTACYFAETNIQDPPTPEEAYLCTEWTSDGQPASRVINGNTYHDTNNWNCIRLSTDPNNPTKIKRPNYPFTYILIKQHDGYLLKGTINYDPSNDAIVDSEVRNVTYKINITDLNNSSNVYTEDFHDGSATIRNNDINYNLNGRIDFTYGHTFKVDGWYRTLNRCDDNTRTSQPIHAYFKIDSPPLILSVRPTILRNGNNCSPDNASITDCVSGTLTDDDNVRTAPNSTDKIPDHNPQDFVLTVFDPDGADDIANVGIFIRPAGQNPSSNEIHNSLHTRIMFTTNIRIYAYSHNESGNNYCSNKSASIKIEYKDSSGHWNTGPILSPLNDSASNNQTIHAYFTKLPYRINHQDIRFRFTTDCWDPNTGANGIDLRIDKIIIDDQIYEAESSNVVATGWWDGSTCVENESPGDTIPTTDNGQTINIACMNGYVRPVVNYIKDSNIRYTGSRFINDDTYFPFVCNGSNRWDCWMNYIWDIPRQSNGQVGEIIGNNAKICPPNGTVNDIGADNYTSHVTNDDNDQSCGLGSPIENPVGGIRITNVVANRHTMNIYFTTLFHNSAADSQGNLELGSALDFFTHVIDRYNESQTGPWWINTSKWFLDLTPPSFGESTVTTESPQVLNVSWSITDNPGGSGIYKIFGQAVKEVGAVDGPIKQQGSATEYTPLFIDSDYSILQTLWNNFTDASSEDYSALIEETDPSIMSHSINILDNEGGTFYFLPGAVDYAGNFNGATTLPSSGFSIGAPWILTKGGMFFVNGYQNLTPITNNNNLSYVGTDNEEITSDDINILSELGLSRQSFRSTVLNNPSSPAYIKNGYSAFLQYRTNWYTALHSQIEFNNPDFEQQEQQDASTSSDLTTNCTGDKPCIVSLHQNNLTAPYCSKQPSIVIHEGDLSIAPSTYSDYQNKTGCIFLVSGDIILGAGNHISPSGGDSQYETVRGFFISGKSIYIDRDDTGDPRDGLYVIGGIIGSGFVSTTTSDRIKGVFFNRSLQLRDNNLYPSVIVLYDPQYSQWSKYFFNSSRKTSVRDTGFKAF